MATALQALYSIRNPDKEALIKARQEALAGPFKDKMTCIEKLLVGGAAGAAMPDAALGEPMGSLSPGGSDAWCAVMVTRSAAPHLPAHPP